MNTILQDPNRIKKVRQLIIVVSVVIPVAVAILFGVKIDGVDLSFLPSIYAAINAFTAVLLIAALAAIKAKNQELHRTFIRICLLLSLLFLVLYIAYHMTSDSTLYGDVNHDGEVLGSELDAIASTKLFYYVILLTHIFLSVAIVPLVLFTYLFAWQGNFARHKRWTRVTWPIWFYVAASGVIVYFMISPYYS